MKAACQKCLECISVPARFKIYMELSKRKQPLSVSELVSKSKLTQPTITYHLQEMVQCGLIKQEKRGRVVKSSIAPRCKNCALI
jgi:DNA-binding transcriptional ArsR family regulator